MFDVNNYCFIPGQALFVRRILSLNPAPALDFLPEYRRLIRSRLDRERSKVHRKPAEEQDCSGSPAVLRMGARYLLPFFLAVLAAMNIGAYTASKLLFPPQELPQVIPPPEVVIPPVEIPLEISSAFLLEPEILTDEIGECYRDPRLREGVIDFFAGICGSAETAGIILEEADRFAIPPGLAFALCWVESRYNSRALNRRNKDGSIDRGLFQLNSNSFPKLSEADYYNPRINVYYGISHLRFCLDMGGSEITALAMYNAGSVRVHSGGTPRQTLDYAATVLSTRRKIEAFFREKWTPFRAAVEAEPLPEPEAPEVTEPRAAEIFRILMLTPLSR
ncbi:MAG: lytic transglycosylase domain-containing protein [Treponema sp.]|nr:lytic transglycosylase domain-containing protein [Treponema sp.]